MKAECLHLIRLTVTWYRNLPTNQLSDLQAAPRTFMYSDWTTDSCLHHCCMEVIKQISRWSCSCWRCLDYPEARSCRSAQLVLRMRLVSSAWLAPCWPLSGGGVTSETLLEERWAVWRQASRDTQDSYKKSFVFSGVREEKSQQHVSGNPSEISMFRLIQHVLTGGVNAATTRCLCHFSTSRCAAETNNQKKGAVTRLFISALMSLCYFRHSSSILSLIKCATFKFGNTAIK